MSFDIFNVFNVYVFRVLLGGGMLPTHCWEALVQNGDMLGYNSGVPYGSIKPNYTADGMFIYSFEANSVTGEFTASFGDAGNEQLGPENNKSRLLIYRHKNGSQVELVWDEARGLYSGSNKSITDVLLTQLGQDVCFQTVAIPPIIIWYTLEELETE